MSTDRRHFLRQLALASGLLALARPAVASALLADGDARDRARLASWLRALRREGLASPGSDLGRAAVRVAQLALGSPYLPNTLEEYLAAPGADPFQEPLTTRLTGFDCVTLVESSLAIARAAARPAAGWDAFQREIERMRYRGGVREGYPSRLHYFSEWISDNAGRGLVRDLGPELGALDDNRPLRFMSTHRSAYRALANPDAFHAIASMERTLDARARNLVPTGRIPAAMPQLRSGDVLAFATSIEGLDCTHTGLAWRDRNGVLRVLHAPLSGGVVQVSRGDLVQYVAGLRTATGILAARPLRPPATNI